jgi:hypothetical protein
VNWLGKGACFLSLFWDARWVGGARQSVISIAFCCMNSSEECFFFAFVEGLVCRGSSTTFFPPETFGESSTTSCNLCLFLKRRLFLWRTEQ